VGDSLSGRPVARTKESASQSNTGQGINKYQKSWMPNLRQRQMIYSVMVHLREHGTVSLLH
jgi:hypothetical protein